jgi:hypothetical protein
VTNAPTLIGGATGVGLAGLLLAYLDAPRRRDKDGLAFQVKRKFSAGRLELTYAVRLSARLPSGRF